MNAEQQKLVEKYPSLKDLFEDASDDYVEFNDGREEKLLTYLQSHPQASQFSKDPVLILNAMDEFASKEAFLISIGSDKAQILTDLLNSRDPKPEVVVELGGYMGYSAILFAHILRKSNPAAHIWSVEFEPRFAKIMAEIVSLAGLQDAITIVEGAADDSLRKLKNDGKVERIDLLFLDHVEDLYEQELKVAMDELKLLKTGALVIADNVVRPGAPKYREYVRSCEGLKSWGLKGLIMPGEFEDEFEISEVM